MRGCSSLNSIKTCLHYASIPNSLKECKNPWIPKSMKTYLKVYKYPWIPKGMKVSLNPLMYVSLKVYKYPLIPKVYLNPQK